jgi:hypothetical protein
MPSFNLEAFKANFKGGARGYLFYFFPIFPSIANEGMSTEAASYLVRTTSLPDNTLEEGSVSWQGYDFKFATKHTYTPIEVEFNVDRNANIRKIFENWFNLIHNPETNRWAPLEDYMVDQTVMLLDYDGAPVMEYKLHHAWPSVLGPVTLDYSSTETAIFSVTFTYAYHTSKASNSSLF